MNYPDNVTERMINEHFGANGKRCANCYHYCSDHTCDLKVIESESDYTADEIEQMTAEQYDELYKRTCEVSANGYCDSFIQSDGRPEWAV